MRALRPFVSVVVGVLVLAVVGCGKESAPSSSPTPATSSAVADTATPQAASSAPASSAVASASAAPAASDAPPPGNVQLAIESVKVTAGKVDRADKKVNANAVRMRRRCLDPEANKDANIDGSVVITLELDTEGKTKKATHKIDGKVPEDFVKCVVKMFEKDDFDTEGTKAKLDIKIAVGPNVKPQK